MSANCFIFPPCFLLISRKPLQEQGSRWFLKNSSSLADYWNCLCPSAVADKLQDFREHSLFLRLEQNP